LVFQKNDTIFVYCHSGVRSAHTTFVLTQLLAYKNVKNYDGSWTEWSNFDQAPIQQDSITSLFK
jgi:thiosulfate/3-mercaptopyruvate sulfurtransferase